MDDNLPNPLKNFTPRANPPKKVEQSPQSAALTDEQLADKDFLRKMCTEELAAIVRKNNGDIKGVPAINALWDRIDGKPGQQVTVDQNLNVVTVNAQVRFIRSIRDNLIIDPVDNMQLIEN